MHKASQIPVGNPFFWLPFFLFSGRAAQAAGLYLFCILWPILTVKIQPSRMSRFHFELGLMLVFAYCLFPIFNIGHIVCSHGFGGLDFATLRLAMASKFSTAVGVSGMAMVLVAVYLPSATSRNIDVSGGFLRGSVLAGSILGVFAFVQMFSGWHFSELAAFRPDRSLPNGLYRITGFCTHPIPFAGFSLVLFSYFSSLLWEAMKNQEHKVRTSALAYLSLLFLFLTIASGSRMAALASLTTTCLILFSSKGGNPKTKAWSLATIVVAIVAFSLSTGLVHRINESLGSGAAGWLGERKIFWSVYWQMILDSPLFGHSALAIDEGQRDVYYNKLGLSEFPRKYTAHNIFFAILASVGILGFSILGAIVLRFIKVSFSSQSGSERRSQKVAILHAFLSLLIFGATQNSLFDTPAVLALLCLGWLCFWSTPGNSTLS